MNPHFPSRLGGLVAFVPTPMRGEDFDEAALRALLDRLLAAGIEGFAVLGSTGAATLFGETERMRIAEVALGHVNRRAAVMVGVGAMTTAETVRLARHAQSAGAEALLVVPVAYWPLDGVEVVEHYAAIGSATRLPIVVYNNPRLTVMDLQPPLLARLAALPSVAGMKESSAELARIAEVKRLAPGLRVSAGRDVQALEALRAGADGWHSGIANLLPRECLAVLRAHRAGDAAAAAQAWAHVAPLAEFAVRHGLLRTVHAGLDLQGVAVGNPRRPLLPLGSAQRAELAAILASAAVQPSTAPA